MAERLNVDLCVIGAGSGGLSVAAGASLLGASVTLVERGRMGGDCLNYGCVPSKALLAAAKAAEGVRRGGRFGLSPAEPEVDFARVKRHVHDVIAEIAPQDSVARFRGLGVNVIQAEARFTGRTQVTAGDTVIDARRIVVATGSAPMVPPVSGLDTVPFLTNETIFELEERPDHLIVIGGGSVGLELAQAFRRLGSRVTVIEMLEVLGRDDAELARIVATRLRAEGIAIHEHAEAIRVEAKEGGIAVTLRRDDGPISGSHILVAVGRKPNLEGLDLATAGIRHSVGGIEVDRRLRTSNRKVFAVGDVTGGYQFTHMAGHHADIVIRNVLFRLPAKVVEDAVPWVTFTDPELAHVGMTEAQARAAHGQIRVLRAPFAENDRARAERDWEGLVKIVTGRKGRILGASIVGASAGEIIQPWILAMSQRLKIRSMAGIIAPYPTLGEANRRAAGSYFTPALFGPRWRRIVRLLGRLG